MSYSGITLALSKGRIYEETLPLLAAAGITPSENPESSRKLIIGTNRADVRLIIVRPTRGGRECFERSFSSGPSGDPDASQPDT